MLSWRDGGAVAVEQICSIIYGVPGTGKTSLALTARNPALLDFDVGVHRAGNRAGKKVLPRVPFSDLERMDADDLAGVDTLVIDTLGPLVDALLDECAGGASPTLKHWGMVKTRFARWLSTLKGFAIDVVILAHTDESQRGETVVERISAAGSSKDLAYQAADLMGRLGVDNSGRRVLDFRPRADNVAKDCGIGAVVIGDPAAHPDTLAEIHDQAREHLNAAAALAIEVADLKGRLRAAECTHMSDVEKKWIRSALNAPWGSNNIARLREGVDRAEKKKFNERPASEPEPAPGPPEQDKAEVTSEAGDDDEPGFEDSVPEGDAGPAASSAQHSKQDMFDALGRAKSAAAGRGEPGA